MENQAESLENIIEMVKQIIDTNGHAIMMITSENPEDVFSYTVGLSDADWPELIVSGLVGHQAGIIINETVRVLRQTEIKPQHGQIIEKAVNVPLRLTRVDPDNVADYAKMAISRNREIKGNPNIELLQVLWPDQNGKYVEEDGYDGKLNPQKYL